MCDAAQRYITVPTIASKWAIIIYLSLIQINQTSWQQNVHYSAYKSQPMANNDPTQSNPNTLYVFSHLYPTSQSCLFPSRFPTKTLHSLLFRHARYMFNPSHPLALTNFNYLIHWAIHEVVFSTLLVPNVTLSTPFSNTLAFSLKAVEKVRSLTTNYSKHYDCETLVLIGCACSYHICYE